jgi:type IV pilus assembly protein PilB
MHRLKDDGLDKVKQGRTSMAEIARVVGSGHRTFVQFSPGRG